MAGRGYCGGEDDKGGSARAGKWKRKFGGVETGKDPLGWEIIVVFFHYYFSNVKPNVKLKVRRLGSRSKDSVMPPQCKAMVSQREVTSASKRGRWKRSPALWLMGTHLVWGMKCSKPRKKI